MILFSTFRDIPEWFLKAHKVENLVMLNLSSYIADYYTLRYLTPNPEIIGPGVILGDLDDFQFDIAYCNYIFANDVVFLDFMQIMIPVFQDDKTCVVILIEENYYCDILRDALIKIIKERYGYFCNIVRTYEDLLYIELESFSMTGLMIMDQDVHRWLLLNPNLGYQLAEYEDVNGYV